MGEKRIFLVSYQDYDNPLLVAQERQRFIWRFCERVYVGMGCNLESRYFLVSGRDINKIALIAKIEPEFAGKEGFLREDMYYNLFEISNYREILSGAACLIRLSEILATTKTRR